jgi:hypothetical protein
MLPFDASQTADNLLTQEANKFRPATEHEAPF